MGGGGGVRWLKTADLSTSMVRLNSVTSSRYPRTAAQGSLQSPSVGSLCCLRRHFKRPQQQYVLHELRNSTLIFIVSGVFVINLPSLCAFNSQGFGLTAPSCLLVCKMQGMPPLPSALVSRRCDRGIYGFLICYGQA